MLHLVLTLTDSPVHMQMYWCNPLSYALKALVVNEFLAPQWDKPLPASEAAQVGSCAQRPTHKQFPWTVQRPRASGRVSDTAVGQASACFRWLFQDVTGDPGNLQSPLTSQQPCQGAGISHAADAAAGQERCCSGVCLVGRRPAPQGMPTALHVVGKVNIL